MGNRFNFMFSAAAFALAVMPARADEGMWTYDHFPSAQVKTKYGFAPDQAWLDKIRLSTARLTTGCSASIVSKNGLMMTNHHCIVECAQNLSSSTQDYVQEGFVSKNIAEEKQCKGMQAEILTKIEDVTPQVKDAIAKAPASNAIKARDAEIAALESKEGCKDKTVRCAVINLYQGGQYKLYTYRIYPDVRLAFAPEVTTAFFGGDPDNFNFPRYDLDSAFVRLYEEGKPINAPNHLAFRADAPKENEVVFVSGVPGSTSRLYTISQLELQRDWALPLRLTMLSELRGRLISYMAQGEEQRRIGTDMLFTVENSFKGYNGRWRALMDPEFMAQKRTEEMNLRNKALASAQLKSDIGDPWADMTKAVNDYRDQLTGYEFLESRAGLRVSSLFSFARKLVRAAEERGKPNAERLRDYSDSKLALMEHEILADNPVYPDLERIALEMWLSKTREYLTVDNPMVKNLLGKDSPEDLAVRLVGGSKLADPKVREALWKGGAGAIAASDDPLIAFARRIDADARAVRKKYDETVDGPTAKASERIAKARFGVYGDSIYPDATSSLRLSYGAVKGWTYQGQTIAPFTNIAGLYERATGSFPFKLAKRWEVAKAKLDTNTPFDISTTNDIIGGNSGSPLIDAQGRAVGAVFDGNIHSLGGDYGYDEKLNRTVAVTTPAILEALRKVYEAPALADELEGKQAGTQ